MYITRKLIPILILLSSLIIFNVAQEIIDDEEEGDGVAVPGTPEDPQDPDEPDFDDGDVILTKAQKQEHQDEAKGRSIAAKKLKYLWHKSKLGKQVLIPYTIQGGVYTQQQLGIIQQAMWDIQNVTCVRFFKRKNQKDFFQIYSKEGHGCFSSLGRTGGLQFVSLNQKSCVGRKAVVHELLHLIGFRHMFKRFDRDNFVTIFWQNIKDTAKSQFTKVQNQYEAYGTKFDLLSAMMYRKNAASKNGKNTIVPKDRSYIDRIGAVTTLSRGDALRINRMYNCPM